jgi:hypothetical protein
MGLRAFRTFGDARVHTSDALCVRDRGQATGLAEHAAPLANARLQVESDLDYPQIP